MAGLGAVRLMADGPVLVAQSAPAQSGAALPTRGRIIRGMERATAIAAIWNASTVVESGAENRPPRWTKVKVEENRGEWSVSGQHERAARQTQETDDDYRFMMISIIIIQCKRRLDAARRQR